MIRQRTSLTLWVGFMLLCTPVVNSLAMASPRPFHAKYSVGDNLATLGEASFALSRQNTQPTQWVFSSRTRATGLFKLIGDKLRGEEQSTLIEKDARLLPLSWYSKGPRHDNGDRDTASFNWDAQQLRSHFNGQTRNDSLNGPVFDRLSIYLEVNRLIEQTSAPIQLNVLDRRGIDNIQVRRVKQEHIQVPAGRFDTVVSERVKDNRTILAWHAPTLDHMPVRLEQYKDGKLRVRLELERFEFAP